MKRVWLAMALVLVGGCTTTTVPAGAPDKKMLAQKGVEVYTNLYPNGYCDMDVWFPSGYKVNVQNVDARVCAQ